MATKKLATPAELEASAKRTEKRVWGNNPSTALVDQVVDHPLYDVLMLAITQAMYGKGERHGGNVTPFMDQPWVHYSKLHGRGFLTGQAAKKLEEAASQRTGEAFEAEVLGAIVYAAMAILKDREDQHETA